MAETHNGVPVNSLIYNGINVQSWIHNGKEVFSSKSILKYYFVAPPDVSGEYNYTLSIYKKVGNEWELLKTQIGNYANGYNDGKFVVQWKAGGYSDRFGVRGLVNGTYNTTGPINYNVSPGWYAPFQKTNQICTITFITSEKY